MIPAPAVTVITITLNDRGGLERTAESLFKQTAREEAEWLIVDGGSVDGTFELARGYVMDPRSPSQTRVLEGPDGGIVDAMSRGARAATGQYLQFLNSGDRYHSPDVLDLVLTHLEAKASVQTSPGWLYGQAQVVDITGRPVRPLHARSYSWIGHAYHWTRINHQAVFLRRELYRQVGGFREAAGTALDYDLLLRIGRLQPPRVLNDILIDYLEGGVSQTTFADGVHRIGRLRREVLGLSGVAAWADRLFVVAFIAYSRARQRIKRLAIAALGDRFLTWWSSRRVAFSRSDRPSHPKKASNRDA